MSLVVGERLHFFLRDELVAGREQFREHHQVATDLGQPRRDGVQITLDVAEAWIELEIADQHGLNNRRAEGNPSARPRIRFHQPDYLISDMCMIAPSAAFVATSAWPAFPCSTASFRPFTPSSRCGFFISF